MSGDAPDLKELHIPPAVFDDPNGCELLRAWAADKSLHVSFHSGFWDAPWKWGVFLADIARHAANAFENDGKGQSADMLESIRASFNDELGEPTSSVETSPLKRH